MSAFSFSAPHLSAEEERRELEALSVEERLLIIRDVYGSVENYLKQRANHPVANHASVNRRHDDVDFDSIMDDSGFRQSLLSAQNRPSAPSACAQDSETMKRSLEMFHEALEAASHQFGAAAYLEARSKCPELVSLESSPRRFLENANFDVWAAADRVIKYWEIRRLLFGQDRTFLPMTLAGAMAPLVPSLEHGLIFPTHQDAFGRMVVFFDRSRATKKVASRDEIAQCFFYVFHKVCSTEGSGSIGRDFVFLVNCRVSTSCTLSPDAR
jgi:hypothetical protein